MAVARSARRVPGARRERKASDRGRRVDARATIGFDEMKSGQERRYVMVGGKGGVGKTSVSASLGVSLAAEGHDVLVVSTDPAHSLSDSLAQDVNGREPRQVEGGEGKLWGLELDPEEARKEFSEVVGQGSGDQMREFMEGFGLGALADQLADLKLGELLETPPPGFDEALAISKVIQLANSPQYSHFSRVVFDTAPTGAFFPLLFQGNCSSAETCVRFGRAHRSVALAAGFPGQVGWEDPPPAPEAFGGQRCGWQVLRRRG